MNKFLFAFALMFTHPLLAQDYVSPPPQYFDTGANYLMMNTATTTSADNNYVPSYDECVDAAKKAQITPDLQLGIRLAQFDYRAADSNIYLETWLCQDKNMNNCVKLKKSITSSERQQSPLTLYVSPHDLGCLLALGEHKKAPYKFLNIRIIAKRWLIDDMISSEFVKTKDLTELNVVETAFDGVLQVFIRMNPDNNN